jgi:hypothetical protein
MSPLLDYRVGHPSMMSVRDLSPAIRLALESLERARRLRPSMTPIELGAARRGRDRLRLRLAYERLSSLDQVSARAALRDGWREGELRSLRAGTIWVASLLPTPILRAVHKVKRLLLRRGRVGDAAANALRPRELAQPTNGEGATEPPAGAHQ